MMKCVKHAVIKTIEKHGTGRYLQFNDKDGNVIKFLCWDNMNSEYYCIFYVSS